MAREPRTKVEAEDRGGGREVRRLLPWAHAIFLVFGLAACGPTRAQRVEADIASVRNEANAQTLLERGKAFAAIGDHTRAEEYLAAAIEEGADPRVVLPLLMDVCVRTGRYRSAIQHGENHLRKHPNDLRTRIVVGALYAAINEGKHAREQLEHVVATAADPERTAGEAGAEGDPRQTAGGPRPPERLKAQAHYLLGVVARDTDKDIVEADRHFREYLRLEPNGSYAEEAKSSLLKRVP
jgi:tetratricopeptide (TPR) repeat protein